MVDYVYILQVGISMLLVICVGFFVFKFKFLPVRIVPYLNQYLLKACYVPLIFRSIGKRKFSELNFMPFVIGAFTTITTHILMCLIFLFKFKDKFENYLGIILPCSFVNYLVIGIPIFDAIWGSENNVVVSLISLSNDLITTPIYLVLSGLYLSKKQEKETGVKLSVSNLVKGILIRIITNPIIIGNILGFCWALAEWEFPMFIKSLTYFTGNEVLGMSLLCVGGFIAQNSFVACSIVKLVIAIIIRHIIMPAISIPFCYAFKLSNDLSRQCVILQCLPTGTTSFLLSSSLGIQPGVSSTMSFWSTCLSVPFIMLWVFVLDKLNMWK